MGLSNAERQRRYRQRHLTDAGGKGARLNIVVDVQTKTRLDRLAACYGVTLREAIGLALDQAETALLDTLSADQRRAYYAGCLSLRRNGDARQDDADHQGHEVDQGHQIDEAGPQDDAGGDRDQTIVKLFKAGESKRGIARTLNISEGTVRNVIKREV